MTDFTTTSPSYNTVYTPNNENGIRDYNQLHSMPLLSLDNADDVLMMPIEDISSLGGAQHTSWAPPTVLLLPRLDHNELSQSSTHLPLLPHDEQERPFRLQPRLRGLSRPPLRDLTTEIRRS